VPDHAESRWAVFSWVSGRFSRISCKDNVAKMIKKAAFAQFDDAVGGLWQTDLAC
jgi:hypothetical protein